MVEVSLALRVIEGLVEEQEMDLAERLNEQLLLDRDVVGAVLSPPLLPLPELTSLSEDCWQAPTNKNTDARKRGNRYRMG